MSTGRVRPGWIVLAAGAVLLSGLVALRLATRKDRAGARSPSRPEFRPQDERDRPVSGMPARPEARRLAEQALLLEALRAPLPENPTEAPQQEKDLRVEAAQHPDQYPSLLRSILQDPAIDARWKLAALMNADVAAGAKMLEVVLEFLRAPASDPLKPSVVRCVGDLCYQLRQNQHRATPSECIGALERLLDHESPAVRSASHSALWRAQVSDLNDEQRTAFVRRVLEDPDANVFTAFYVSLIGTNGLRGTSVAEELARQFSRFGDPRKRVAIISALGEASDGKGHSLLSGALTDGDPSVRRAAVAAIARSRDASMLPTLKLMLGDEAQTDAATKSALLKCLAGFDNREAVRTIGEFALGQGAPALRNEALGLLQSSKAIKGDEELAALLIGALERSEEAGRKGSLLFAIGMTGTSRAAETLRREYGKAEDPDLRESAVRAALGVEQDAAYALLAEALPKVSVMSLKRGILTFLGDQRRPELLPVLRAEYEAPSSAARYRLDLIDAAVRVGSPAAAAFVRDLAGREKDEEVRKRLQEALEEFKN